MTANTDTIFNSLIQQLSVYALSETHPDAFTVKRMKKEAQKIIDQNTALGASMYGLIAAVEGHLEEAEKQHALATQLSRKHDYVRFHAMSMRTLGHHAEAFRLMQSIIKVIPDPIDFINAEIGVSFDVGYYQVAIDYYIELGRIGGKITIDSLIYVYFSTLVINSYMDLKLFPLVALLVKSIQKKYHVKEPSTLFELIDIDLYFWIEITKDEPTIALMNEELENGMDLFTDFNLRYFHISFITPQDRPEQQIDYLYEVIHGE